MAEDQIPEEVKSPGYEEIHNQSMRTLAVDEGVSEIPEAKPEVEPEKPVEPVDEKIVEDERRQIAEEAARKVVEEQETRRIEAEKAEREVKEPTDKEKSYLDWESKFKEKNDRSPTYLEALAFVEEQAIASIEQRQIETENQKKAETERVQAEQDAETERMNAYVDDELQDLYTANKLTKIKDPNNPSDQGVVERKALFNTWQQVNEERKNKGLPEIISATRIYEFYYKKPSAQPAGADAPISGNRSSAVSPSSEQEYSYQDLKKPWSVFKRR